MIGAVADIIDFAGMVIAVWLVWHTIRAHIDHEQFVENMMVAMFLVLMIMGFNSHG